MRAACVAKCKMRFDVRKYGAIEERRRKDTELLYSTINYWSALEIWYLWIETKGRSRESCTGFYVNSTAATLLCAPGGLVQLPSENDIDIDSSVRHLFLLLLFQYCIYRLFSLEYSPNLNNLRAYSSKHKRTYVS